MDSQGSVAKLVKTVDYRECVHYKSGGSTGQKWPTGTWQDPCGSLSDVRGILTARSLYRLWVHGAATLDADMTHINWMGDTIGSVSVVGLNGKSVDGGVFNQLTLLGNAYVTSIDSIQASDCAIFITTNPVSIVSAIRCAIVNDSVDVLHLSGNCILYDCFSYIAGNEAVIEYSSGAGYQFNAANWIGDLLIQGLVAGAVVNISGIGKVSINGTGGTVTVRGDIEVTDLSAGAVTIDDQTSFAQRAAIKTDTAAILVAVTGGAADARFERSAAGTVEEDAYQNFDISIFDIDAGAVATADIDITAISAVMEKSTGGGVFSSAGITQPTFLKADGRVYCAYRFLAAEWAVGDLYRLRVTGITAEVDSVIVHVTAMVWSNAVIEAADVSANVIDIKTETDKMAGATGILFEQEDVPVKINATDVEADILDLSAASTRYTLRDLLLKCADPGAETVTVRLYRPINDVPVMVKDFEITTLTYTGYFNLMDMFGVPHLSGDDIRIAVIASAPGPYAITGQYSYAKTNV